MKTGDQLRRKRLSSILPQVILTLAVLVIFSFRNGRFAFASEQGFVSFCLNGAFVGVVTFFVMSVACAPLNRLAEPEGTESQTSFHKLVLVLWFAQNLGILLLFVAICGIGSSGYYQFLRYFVCVLSLICAACGFKLQVYFWAAVFVGVAVIFNPISPVRFERLHWMMIDWAVIGLLVYNPIANAVDDVRSKSRDKS